MPDENTCMHALRAAFIAGKGGMRRGKFADICRDHGQESYLMQAQFESMGLTVHRAGRSRSANDYLFVQHFTPESELARLQEDERAA